MASNHRHLFRCHGEVRHQRSTICLATPSHYFDQVLTILRVEYKKIEIWADWHKIPTNMKLLTIKKSKFCNKNIFLPLYNAKHQLGNTNWGGRLSTVDLLIELTLFCKKVNNIKISWSNLVSTTVLSLPLQQDFPAKFLRNASKKYKHRVGVQTVRS